MTGNRAMRTPNAWKVPAALAAVVLISASCTTQQSDAPTTTTSTSQAPIPFTGLTQDLRIRWTAEPGIDLLTGPPVIIRAYRESYILGGLMASPDFYYPGFEHAVPPAVPATLNYAVRPYLIGDPHLEDSGFQTTTPIVGTWRQHILSLTGDRASGYTALVCSWDYATAVQQPGGDFTYAHRFQVPETTTPNTGTRVYRITLTAPPASAPDPAATIQRGTAPKPSTDVFGGWKILTALKTYTSPIPALREPDPWPRDVYNRDYETCVAKAPDSYERRSFFITGEHPRSDFPTLPADPGWSEVGT